jgi:parallel beta-helix repeat protein
VVGPRRKITCPPRSVKLRPGRRLQAVIDAHPEGTSFCLGAGTYRLKRPLLPKSGNKFVGRYGAVLRGSKVVSDWTRRGGRWVATGQTQENAVVGGVPCRAGTACDRPEGIFIGKNQLRQVTSLSAVRRGRFYFDYPNNTIYIANDPRGHRVEASVAGGAFLATHHFAKGVVIRNLIIERFANPSRTGVIFNTNSPGWLIANNEVGQNHGVGIAHHDKAQVRNNDIHHNGQLGLAGYRSVGAVVSNNEIARNAIGGFAGWETGGAKYVGTTHLTIRGNYVHGNRHHGLWTDTDNVDTVYSRNTIIGNKGMGIFHEAASSCIIRSNYIARNGGDGIFISSSSNVEAFENIVALNRLAGIHLFIDGASGHDLANNYVHGNLMRMRGGTYNGITTTNVGDPAAYSTSKNNRFRGNSYVVPRLRNRYWYWSSTLKTWSQWRSAGQDRRGNIRRL